MYERNPIGTISLKKVKGYQSTFEEFLYEKRSCHDLNNDDVSIHAGYNSPEVAQSWDII